MNTLTPSEQEIVNEAAKLEASFQCHHEDRIYAGQICFHAGVEFALQELVKGRWVREIEKNIIEWYKKKYYSQGSSYSVRITKKGKWAVKYTNDYPMQHGDGDERILTEEEFLESQNS